MISQQKILRQTKDYIRFIFITGVARFTKISIFSDLNNLKDISVLNALDSKEIEPYWFETGTPSFLARWVKAKGMDPKDLNHVLATKKDLVTVGFDQINPAPLMYQTGYLSIEKYDKDSGLFTLGSQIEK